MKYTGHTSGLGNGLFLFALFVFGAIGVLAGIAFGLTAVFHNPFVSAAAGAAVGLFITYRMNQTRRDCLALAACPGGGGLVAAWSAPPISAKLSTWISSPLVSELLGTTLGIAVGVVFTLAATIIMVMCLPNQPRDTPRWRKNRNA